MVSCDPLNHTGPGTRFFTPVRVVRSIVCSALFGRQLVSIIAGLGLTNLAQSFRVLIRPGHPVRWDGLPLAWSAFVFLFTILLWWNGFSILEGTGEAGRVFLIYLLIFFLIYLCCAFVLRLFPASRSFRARRRPGSLLLLKRAQEMIFRASDWTYSTAGGRQSGYRRMAQPRRAFEIAPDHGRGGRACSRADWDRPALGTLDRGSGGNWLRWLEGNRADYSLRFSTAFRFCYARVTLRG